MHCMEETGYCNMQFIYANLETGVREQGVDGSWTAATCGINEVEETIAMLESYPNEYFWGP